MEKLSKTLKKQILDDYHKLIMCSNDLWKLRTSLDSSIDDLENSLREAGILEKDDYVND